jgi:copper(I)-binding protein
MSLCSTRKSPSLRAALALAAALASTGALAQVAVSDAWVRATVPGQQSTGAYMRLTATRDARLVSVSTPVAKFAEIHETTDDRGVMRMHAVPTVTLPAGKPVELKPNGYHVMLMQLTRQLNDGDPIPLVLTVQDASGAKTNLQVNALVRPLTAGAGEPESKHSH